MTPSELLALEERQLYYFLTCVRPVGEEKSELYPEPQYFNTAFISVAAQLPEIIDRITVRTTGAAEYAKRLRRVLSPSTALHTSGLAFLATWGREMWLQEEAMAKSHGTEPAGGAPLLSDTDTGRILQFSYDVVCNYRQDGRAYPNLLGALGTDYRILDADVASVIAAEASSVDTNAARDILGLLAAIRAVSFLMEAETREALMMHGPYDTGHKGHQLVLFECTDLHWSLFPNFPIGGGVGWRLPERQFPVANLAIALVLKDAKITADRFGTLYIDPLNPENVVAAKLLTRGSNAYVDEGLSVIPNSEASDLRTLCDEIQEYMFLQIASWEIRQRMEAAVYQEHMLLLRMLYAAGASEEELRKEQQRIFSVSAPIISKYFDSSLARSVDKLPYYQKLGAFVAGDIPSLFTPLS